MEQMYNRRDVAKAEESQASQKVKGPGTVMEIRHRRTMDGGHRI